MSVWRYEFIADHRACPAWMLRILFDFGDFGVICNGDRLATFEEFSQWIGLPCP